MDIELSVSIFLILIGAGGAFVQRVSGFGLGIFSMLFLPHVMPTHTAAASISSLFTCTSSTYNTIKYHKEVPYKTVLPMLITALITIPVAVYFSGQVSPRLFQILLGSVLIVLSIYFLFFNSKIHFKPTTAKGIIAGATGGILSGLFSTGGPPVVLYMTHATNDNLKYFAGIQFYFCVTNIYSTIMRAINGFLSLELLVYTLIGSVGCFVGDLIGKLVFDKLDGKKLKMVIYIGMIVSGITMLIP